LSGRRFPTRNKAGSGRFISLNFGSSDEMESDGASGIWLIAVFGGPVLLGLALVFGLLRWRKRRASAERVGEAVARDNYAAEAEREERRERQAN
jgi:hypothetical protein